VNVLTYVRKHIRAQLVIIIVLFTCLLVVSLSIIINTRARQNIEQEVIQRLASVTLLKASEYERWIEGNQVRLEALAQRPLVRSYTTTLTTLETLEHNSYTKYANLLLYEHLLPALKREGGYLELSIISAQDGEILVSTDSQLVGSDRETERFFQQGKKQTFVQKPTLDPRSSHPLMHITTPIKNEADEVVGVLAGHLDLEEISRIMTQHRGGTLSEETYLVNLAHRMISESRFLEDTVFQDFLFTAGVNTCLKGQNGHGMYRDYRGIPVVGSYRWLPDHGLCILTEEDQSEAFASIFTLQRNIALIGAGVMLAGIIVGFLFSQRLTRPIKNLSRGAQVIKQGNLDYRIQVQAENELGILAENFNRMVDQLQAWNEELENRVQARTRELEEVNRSLRMEMDFSQKVINSIPGIFYVFDQEGTFLRWNDNFCEISGYSDKEIARLRPSELFRPQERSLITHHIQEVFEEGKTELETQLVSRSGKATPFYLTGMRTTFHDEPILIGTGTDISELVETQKKLETFNQELQRSNQELQRFAYIASHDLQEPLRMVISYLQLLEQRYKEHLDQDAREFIQYAVDGASRMKQLINDLLTYSRVGSQGTRFKKLDLNHILGQAHIQLKHAIQENGAVISTEELPTIWADERQMVQLFQNLIGNSIKFRGEANPVIHIQAREHPEEWLFSVQDNGIGIDPRYSKKIFVIFQRLHREERFPGTGLGLAICKRIVEQHKGEIWVDSQPGEGAIFSFTISKHLKPSTPNASPQS
jgi:PAS domain S-box-containing protein